MQCVMSVRRLKPGTYEAFLDAVAPDVWPAGLTRIEVLRNGEDPDEVCTIGYFDLSADDLDALRDDPALWSAEAERIERVAAFADTVVVNGVFEVADELRPPA